MALTASRNTPERPGNLVALPVAAATLIYLGALIATDANGRLVPASDTAGLRVKGRAEEQADNSAGAAGAISCTFRRGVFLFANSATNAITAAMVGKLAFVEDDETVASTTTHKIVAGRIVEVTAEGVWIDTRDIPVFSVPAPTSTNGTMAAAVDDAATKAEGEKIGDDVRATITALAG